jgi:uncharacterized protein (UPF0332 family)
MTVEIRDLLDRSGRSIDAAKLLLEEGYRDFAASRAYYAMFYAVEALLLSKGLSFSKHSGVIAEFGKKFIKTGIFDSRHHRSLIDAFNTRNAGDYGAADSVSDERANQTITDAADLLAEVKRYREEYP